MYTVASLGRLYCMEQMFVAEIMKEWAYFWKFVEATAQDRPDLEIFQYLIA